MRMLLYTDNTVMNQHRLIAIMDTLELELNNDKMIEQAQDNENLAHMLGCDRIFLSTLCVFLFLYFMIQCLFYDYCM